MQQELPSSILRTVRSFCHCHPLSCTVELLLHDSFVFVFRLFAPFFHNVVSCASPFPPVFGLFFALPASFVAAIGLPLRLFARQAAEMSRTWHPRAPRRRMFSRIVRNLKTCEDNAALLPSLSTATVRFLSHHLPVSCVEKYLPGHPTRSVFRLFAPLFHNIGICASPLPPVLGLLSPSLPLSLLRLGYLCACSLAR